MDGYVLGRDFGAAVCAVLGLDPNRVARIVIDAPADGVVVVHAEMHAPAGLLEVLPTSADQDAAEPPAPAPVVPVDGTEPPNPRPDDLTCGWCGEVFTSKQKRASHEGRHIIVRCDGCGATMPRTGMGPHRKACEARRLEERRRQSPGAPDDDEVARRRERAAAAAYGDGF